MTAEKASELADKANQAEDERAMKEDLPLILKNIKREAGKGNKEFHYMAPMNDKVRRVLIDLHYRLTVARTPASKGATGITGEEFFPRTEQSFKTIIHW